MEEAVPVLTRPHLPIEQSSSQPQSAVTRIVYLDNLRAGAMLAGLFLHGAFAYADPAQSFWLAADPQSSRLLDAAIWLIHLFRMSLFFLLAGYFAKMAVARKGMAVWFRNRMFRLLIPFVVSYPVLLLALGIVIQFAVTYIEHPTGLLGLILSGDSLAEELHRPAIPGTMHLWFLHYLILFSGLTWVAIPLRGVSFDRWFRRPLFWGLAPLALLPGILAAGIPLPSPESVIPSVWPLAFYGLFYWAGWQWFGRESALDGMQPFVWPLVLGSLLLFIPYYACLPNLDLPTLLHNPPRIPIWKTAIGAILTAYLSTSLTVSACLLGKRYLDCRRPGLRLLADAAYWVYLVHLPILLFLQTLLIPFPWPAVLKLLVVLLGTGIFSLATYLVFVRYTPVGWLLHGKRSFP